MTKKKKSPTDTKQLIENKITDQIYNEYSVAKRNQDGDNADFEAIIDLLECRRNERDYEWMSDVFIPEYPSIHLTEASQWANQYFQTRDFVDVYLSGETEADQIKAAMVKRFINTTLNMRDIFHFIKYMQLRGTNSTRGVCYALCRWEREVTRKSKPFETFREVIDPNTGLVTNQPMMGEQVEEKILVDRFNYDPLDTRNVFTDNKYVYSLQQKDWIIIRDEVTYEQLKAEAKRKGYFNLDKVDKLKPPDKTDTEKDTTENQEHPQKPVLKFCDRLLRFGKMWSIVTEADPEDEYPIVSEPAVDEFGNVKEGAELIESIVEEIYVGTERVLIRFQPLPYRTSKGVPFRPILRGLCYVHPTKDIGMSDGKYSRELQIALNDTINMSNDRTKLSTLPTLKGTENAVIDNDQIYFEPEHVITVPNINDLEEFKINPDVRGAMEQAGLFINKMQQVNSIYPNTMGEMGPASTTATAVAGSQQQSNLRANYKSLTFEYTFLAELYWMMLQMGHQFMHPKTAILFWGEQAKLFDPDADYSYTPVSSNIEQEYSKDRKVQRYDQMLGRIVGLAPINPGVVPIIAFILGEQATLLGAEYQRVAGMLQALVNTPTAQEQPTAAPGTENQPQGAGMMPTSNQSGMPQSIMEQGTREMTGGM